MTNPRPYKLKPGSPEAQTVELLRFLPAGTAMRVPELRAHLGWPKKNDASHKLAAAAKHGLLRSERRRNDGDLRSCTFWMAGGAR